MSLASCRNPTSTTDSADEPSFDEDSALAITTTWIDGSDAGSTLYDSGDTLRVEVTYDFRFLVFSNLLALFGGNLAEVFDLHAVTLMRLE